MRFMFLNPVSEFGGAERSLVSWMAAARQAYPAAALSLVVPGDGLLAARAAALGVAIERLPLPPALARLGDSGLQIAGGRRLRAISLGAGAALSAPAAGAYLWQLRRLLDRLKPDVIHSNGIKTHLALNLARRAGFGGLRGTPIVWHLHDFVGQRPLVARLLRRATAGLAAGVAVSQAVASDARLVLPTTPIRVVHNVADLQQFSPASIPGAWLDEQAGLPPAVEGTVRVVLVATYARWKGQDVFLQAAAALTGRAALPPLRFYIVGGPIYQTAGSQFSRDELMAVARHLGTEQHVGFIPFQSEPADAYRAADIVVHASTRPEPFGLTIVEAMACGRAVVVSRAGGAAELFSEGRDAVGVPPSDPAALADLIARLARDAELRRELGGNARSTAWSRFNPADLPAAVRAVYDPLLPREPQM